MFAEVHSVCFDVVILSCDAWAAQGHETGSIFWQCSWATGADHPKIQIDAAFTSWVSLFRSTAGDHSVRTVPIAKKSFEEYPTREHQEDADGKAAFITKYVHVRKLLL